MSKQNSTQSGRNNSSQNDASSRLPVAPRNASISDDRINDHHDQTQNRVQPEQVSNPAPDRTTTDHSDSTDPSHSLSQASLICLPVDMDSTTIRQERLMTRQRSLNSILDEAISISEEILSDIRNETGPRVDGIEIAPRIDGSSNDDDDIDGDDDDGEWSGNNNDPLPKQ